MGQYVTRLVQAVLRPVVRLAAKRAARIHAGAGRIDTHIHALPPAYLAELTKAGVSLMKSLITSENPRIVLTRLIDIRAILPDFQHQNGRPNLVLSRCEALERHWVSFHSPSNTSNIVSSQQGVS